MISPPITLGTDIFSREVVRRDLFDITHMLVAGTTGFGKSVYLHQPIAQCVSRADIERLYLVDFKGGVEFWRYQRHSDQVQVIWEIAGRPTPGNDAAAPGRAARILAQQLDGAAYPPGDRRIFRDSVVRDRQASPRPSPRWPQPFGCPQPECRYRHHCRYTEADHRRDG